MSSILNDSPAKAVLKLSYPIVILNLVKAGFNITDLFWLGKLGKNQLAGVNASIFMVWSLYLMTAFVTVGIVAVVSRNIGEKAEELARSNSTYSIFISIVMGLLFTFLIYPAIDPVISLMNLEESVKRSGVEYLYVITAGTVLIFMMSSLYSVFIARGDTRTPLKINITAFILNIFLSPLLMLGFGFIPRLETKGAALATLFSHLFAIIWLVIVIFKRKWLSFRLHPDHAKVKTYLKLGYPIAISGTIFSFIYFYIAKVAAGFGTDPIAAMGIGHNVESIPYFTGMGFAAGVATYTGQNLGAKQFDRVEKGGLFAVKFIAAISFVYSVLIVIFPELFVKIFNSDPGVISEGASYLRIVFLVETFMIVTIVIKEGILAGSGYTKPSFYISIPIYLLRIPGTYFAAVTLGMGTTGIWLVISLTMFAEFVYFFYIFIRKRERWLHHKL